MKVKDKFVKLATGYRQGYRQPERGLSETPNEKYLYHISFLFL